MQQFKILSLPKVQTSEAAKKVKTQYTGQMDIDELTYCYEKLRSENKDSIFPSLIEVLKQCHLQTTELRRFLTDYQISWLTDTVWFKEN
jgi:hypothetical protein